MIINKSKKLTERAKRLRKESTLAEIILWKYLKNKQIKGKKFRRQVPIENYIVDFFCKELMLAIEIDGASHFENEKYDIKRNNELKELGIDVLHIPDSRVKKSVEGVILEIEDKIDKIKDN